MKGTNVSLVLFVLMFVAAPALAEENMAMQIDKAWLMAPATKDAPEFSAAEVKAIYFDGLPWQSKPTLPGMVMIHGGGGSAFDRWVRSWTKRGYAAIAMDTCGQLPIGDFGNYRRDVQGGPAGCDGFDQIDQPAKVRWTYHAVADTIPGPAAVGGPRPAQLPNVVYILCDDLGYGDVHALNPQRGKIPTPHLDKLAAQGMTFTDAHSSSSVCTPSRYGILTGRYSWRTRLQASILNSFSRPLIAADRLTVPGLLKKYGYHTAGLGKWHLGWELPIEGNQVQTARPIATPVWATKVRYTPGQVWCPAHVPRTDVNPRPLNPQLPSNGLIGCFSGDEKLIWATAWEPYQELFQGVIRCLHGDFRLGGLEPGATKNIRGKIHIVEADVPSLLRRYEADFPEHCAPKKSIGAEDPAQPGHPPRIWRPEEGP